MSLTRHCRVESCRVQARPQQPRYDMGLSTSFALEHDLDAGLGRALVKSPLRYVHKLRELSHEHPWGQRVPNRPD